MWFIQPWLVGIFTLISKLLISVCWLVARSSSWGKWNNISRCSTVGIQQQSGYSFWPLWVEICCEGTWWCILNSTNFMLFTCYHLKTLETTETHLDQSLWVKTQVKIHAVSLMWLGVSVSQNYWGKKTEKKAARTTATWALHGHNVGHIKTCRLCPIIPYCI